MTDNTTPIMDAASESQFVVPAEVEANSQAQVDNKSSEATPPAGEENVVDVVLTPEQEAAKKADAKVAREAFMARKAQRKADEAAARVDALEKRLADAESRAVAPPKSDGPQAPKRPNPNDFELQRWDPKYEEAMAKYEEAKEAYVFERATAAAREAASGATRDAQAATHMATLSARANEVGKKGVDKYADFEQTVQDAFEAMPPAPEALRKVVQLENAEDVFYHLAQHPEMLEKITAMEPMDQALEFGKISARLGASAKVAAKVTKAQPTPTQPRGGNGQYSKESDARYEKMLKAQETW